MSATWIVTADRTEARIFARSEQGLVLVHATTDQEGRRRDAELGTDRPGRTFDRSGHGRHALEPQVGLHEQAARLFAGKLAHFLREARLQGRFSRLVVFAEAHFLGILRAALDKQTAESIVKSVPKDLQHLPAQELNAHLVDV